MSEMKTPDTLKIDGTISCGSANIPIQLEIDNENKNKVMGQGQQMTDNNEIKRDTTR